MSFVGFVWPIMSVFATAAIARIILAAETIGGRHGVWLCTTSAISSCQDLACIAVDAMASS